MIDIGGVPPLPDELQCMLGPEQLPCDDRESALESVDRRIGELYAIEDRESVLSDLDTWQRCFVGLLFRSDRGCELLRWTYSECENLTLADKICEKYQ